MKNSPVNELLREVDVLRVHHQFTRQIQMVKICISLDDFDGSLVLTVSSFIITLLLFFQRTSAEASDQ